MDGNEIAVQERNSVDIYAAGGITPMAMLERAVSSGADIGVLERLLDLQERWQTNQAQRAFTEAISTARGDLPAIVKSKKVDFTTAKGRTNYQYEDLADIIEQVAPVLSRHGLSFRWRTDSDTPGSVKVTCILSHSAGHSEETALSGPIDTSGNKNPIQAIGSVVTYLQRYTLKATLGIAAGTDDDGRQGAPTQSAPPQGERQAQNGSRQPPSKTEPQTDPYKLFLDDCARAKAKIGEDAYYRILGNLGFEHANEVPARLMRDLIGRLAEEARQPTGATQAPQDAPADEPAQEPAEPDIAPDEPPATGDGGQDAERMAREFDEAQAQEASEGPDPTPTITPQAAGKLTKYASDFGIALPDLVAYLRTEHGVDDALLLTDAQHKASRVWIQEHKPVK